MKTKWTILEARAAAALTEYVEIRNRLDGFEATPCGLTCSGCGTLLETEGDFARHFTIPDERFLNLGDCSVNPRPRAMRIG